MVIEWIDTFELDLTEDEHRLCEWIAGQARLGVRRAPYASVQMALGILDKAELTYLLRGLRERVDAIHAMIQSPIVNTAAPYFDIHINAGSIWDRYGRAEQEAMCHSYDACPVTPALVPC
ncbi:MAG: hypothetical protein JW741_22600 [Sedimentisphaerales bacterium]|nr:hypothetical protein [Sedimentisphaerales bacterium]